MAQTALTGGCLCGGVRFEVTEPLVGAAYCHCTRCQRRSGTAAAASARAPRGAVRVTHGADLVRTFVPPEHGWPKAFCSVCGSALWSQDREDGELRSVRMGALDRDPGVTFTHRQFTDEAATWEPIPDDGLPRFGGAKPAS
jgi:hypothetical protein